MLGTRAACQGVNVIWPSGCHDAAWLAGAQCLPIFRPALVCGDAFCRAELFPPSKTLKRGQ
eukprot:8227036-Alexandrium_andersonii.AAC.1